MWPPLRRNVADLAKLDLHYDNVFLQFAHRLSKQENDDLATHNHAADELSDRSDVSFIGVVFAELPKVAMRCNIVRWTGATITGEESPISFSASSSHLAWASAL
jgi:hypothetical protein